MKVAADRFDSRMQTLPREDFPTLPAAGVAPQLAALPSARVKKMVAKTQFCDHRRRHAAIFLNGALVRA